MILSRTVFILGAGASCDFKFPSGQRLVDIIVDHLDHRKDNEWRDILGALGHRHHSDIDNFATYLKKSHLYSIDEFLLRHSEFMELAKKCIALALIPFEKDENLSGDHWCRYLFNNLVDSVTDWRKLRENELSIITFNYDRSLDHYLFKGLKHTFSLSPQDTLWAFETIPIVHVYGKLGGLPGCAGGAKEEREYTPALDWGEVSRAASQIITIPELLKEKPDTIDHAISLLNRDNESIYLLGFGYNNKNLDMLHFDRARANRKNGTCVGLGLAEREYVSREWKILFPSFGKYIMDFMKEEISWR